MTNSESGLHSGEGTVGFEMVSELLINLAFEDFRKAWQDGYKLSKKRNVLSLSTAFTFSKLNMCKYLYEHNKIQQLRH